MSVTHCLESQLNLWVTFINLPATQCRCRKELCLYGTHHMQNKIAALVHRGSGKKPLLSRSTCWKVLPVREGSHTILSECRFHVLVETSQLQACGGLQMSGSRVLLLL